MPLIKKKRSTLFQIIQHDIDFIEIKVTETFTVYRIHWNELYETFPFFIGRPVVHCRHVIKVMIMTKKFEPIWYDYLLSWCMAKISWPRFCVKVLCYQYIGIPIVEIRYILVRSRNCGCLVAWFCYQLIAKPGNKTAAVSWPDTYLISTEGFPILIRTIYWIYTQWPVSL